MINLLNNRYLAYDININYSIFYNVDMNKTVFNDIDLSDSSFINVNLENVCINDACYDGMKIDGILVSDLLKVYKKHNIEEV